MQIFHAIWLVDDDGEHPQPYTLVSADDVESGRWRVDEVVARSVGLEEEYAQRQLLHYTRALEAAGKYKLTIWPYHAMLGGIGHALVPAVEEAVFFHAVARRSQPDFQQKGHSPLTEHYSVLGPEVTRGPDGELLGAPTRRCSSSSSTSTPSSIAGQAKSHCVAWTIDDLLRDLRDERGLAEKVYLLEDCTSPVVVPGASTTPRRPMPPSSASRPPACTSCARPTRSRTGPAWPPRPLPEPYSTSASRGLARKRRPTLAEGRPSVMTTSPVKSFSPRISDEPTP